MDTSTYLAQSISTASPARLVLMLFDGALARVRRAELSPGDLHVPGSADALRDIQRAQAIVSELQLSLDHRRGGEIAANLDALYDFCLDQLRTALRDRDRRPLEPVARILGELREAWNQACVTVAVPVG